MPGSQRLQDWISGGETRRLAGHDVFVRTALAPGRPPLLLIHGYPTASYDWHRVWSRLAARHSLYALDLLGFGLSAKPVGTDYPIGLQADLCMALLDDCGVTNAHVLAHDYGDTVAQELLARAMGYARFEATMLSISGTQPPSREELQDLWLLIERDGGRLALARLINYMEQRRRNRARWVGALVESKVPRRLICGAVDPVSGRHLADRYRELVPEPDVVVLEGVGHYPQLEVHDRVVDEYEAFRSRVDGP